MELDKMILAAHKKADKQIKKLTEGKVYTLADLDYLPDMPLITLIDDIGNCVNLRVRLINDQKISGLCDNTHKAVEMSITQISSIEEKSCLIKILKAAQ